MRIPLFVPLYLGLMIGTTGGWHVHAALTEPIVTDRPAVYQNWQRRDLTKQVWYITRNHKKWK